MKYIRFSLKFLLLFIARHLPGHLILRGRVTGCEGRDLVGIGTVVLGLGHDSSVVNHPGINLEMVGHEGRELAFENGAVAADDVLFTGIRVVFLTHDCMYTCG